MREFEIEEKLKKTLSKLSKKDNNRYSIIIKKIEEILNSEDIEHYKNLNAPLQGFKRVHIDKSFVLLFKHIKQDDSIVFYKLEHHDKVYLI